MPLLCAARFDAQPETEIQKGKHGRGEGEREGEDGVRPRGGVAGEPPRLEGRGETAPRIGWEGRKEEDSDCQGK